MEKIEVFAKEMGFFCFWPFDSFLDQAKKKVTKGDNHSSNGIHCQFFSTRLYFQDCAQFIQTFLVFHSHFLFVKNTLLSLFICLLLLVWHFYSKISVSLIISLVNVSFPSLSFFHFCLSAFVSICSSLLHFKSSFLNSVVCFLF